MVDNLQHAEALKHDLLVFYSNNFKSLIRKGAYINLLLLVWRVITYTLLDPNYDFKHITRTFVIFILTFAQSSYNFKSVLGFHIALYICKNLVLFVAFQSIFTTNTVQSHISLMAIQKFLTMFDNFTFLYPKQLLILNMIPYFYL